MPINNLTAGLTNQMPQLGQLRKGEKKPPNSKKPGKDLTYFRFVCHDDAIRGRFHEIYKDEPRIINIHLAFPDLERNFPTWREEHGKGGLKHRCDGKTMILWQDEDGMYHTDPKPCPYAEYPENDPRRKCAQTGLLHVIIDELLEWGYVEVVTGGKWDCIGLTENVLEVIDMARRATGIKGYPVGVQEIPCLLKREPRMTSCPPFEEGGPRVRQEKWMLYLYVHPRFLQALMEDMRRYSLPVVDLPQIGTPGADIEVDYYVENGNGDIEHPETEIVGEEPEPEPAANDNDKWPARPWNAETTRAALNKALETIDPDGRKTLETYRKSALATLSKLTLGNDDARHKLTWYLFGEESTKELTLKHFAVITDKWTKVMPPDFEPDPSAVEETQNILEALGFETEAATEAA